MRRVLLICWIGLLVLGSQVNAQTVNLCVVARRDD